MHIACPGEYEPGREMLTGSGGNVTLTRDPRQAAAQADLVVTDTWMSMGQESERQKRQELFKPFQVNEGIMAQAAGGCDFYALPAGLSRRRGKCRSD